MIDAANKNRIWEAYAARHYARVLELGPWNGLDTVHLARHCDELVVVEARPANLRDVEAALRIAGLSNVRLVRANLECYDLAQLGHFDVVWASGILYHLPCPWTLVRSITAVTDLCLGWSHLAERAEMRIGNYRGRLYVEPDPEHDPLGGQSTHSYWIVPDDFRRLWSDCGFSRFEWLTPPEPHPNGGLAAQFVTQKAADQSPSIVV